MSMSLSLLYLCVGFLTDGHRFLTWTGEGDQADPTGDQKRMVELQKVVAEQGGFHRLDVKRTTVAASA